MVKSMIENALKYIVGLAETKIKNVSLPDGTVQVYSDRPMSLVEKHIPMADPVRMCTLTSLLDYIKEDVDVMAGRMIIHVTSPEEVLLYSRLNEKRKREYLVTVKCQAPEFNYGRFMDHESFCIGVQSKFISDPNTDKELLLKFAGTVESGSVSEYGDDGVTQKATVRNGIASKTDAIVPNPVKLRPYRTFPEVEQPASSFIFRMKENDGVCCALFEADGGAWKNEAMCNIKEYLKENLADRLDQFTVIS